jgi:hypothetical protein
MLLLVKCRLQRTKLHVYGRHCIERGHIRPADLLQVHAGIIFSVTQVIVFLGLPIGVIHDQPSATVK